MLRFFFFLLFPIFSFALPHGVGIPCSNRPYWDALVDNARVKIILKDAEKKLNQPIPPWDESVYDEFFRNGSRRSAEDMLNARKMFLFPLVIAECVRYDGRYLAKISEVMSTLLSQPSWVLPAHIGTLSNKTSKPYIFDLFTSQLVVELAQATHLLEKELPPRIISNTNSVIYERVIRAVDNDLDGFVNQNWWFVTNNNWIPVCGRGLYYVVANYSKNKFAKKRLLNLLDKKIEDYRNSFAHDGYADEGIDYWHYGLSHYAELEFFKHQILKIIDNDESMWPSLSRVVFFRQKIDMGGDVYSSIGDSIYGKTPERFIDYWYVNNSGVKKDAVLPFSSAINIAGLFRFPMVAFFQNHNVLQANDIGRYNYFDSSGVLVFRPENLGDISIVFKGGVSKSHAHNDSGSFSLARNGYIAIGDIGRPIYKKSTFGVDRDKILTIGSFGHSVPVIDGKYQLSYPKVKNVPVLKSVSKDFVSVKAILGRLYGKNPESFVREMKINLSGKQAIILTDKFNLDHDVKVEEVFVTREPAEIVARNILQFGSEKSAVCMIVSKPRNVSFLMENFSSDGVQFARFSALLPFGSTEFLAQFHPGFCS